MAFRFPAGIIAPLTSGTWRSEVLVRGPLSREIAATGANSRLTIDAEPTKS